MSKRFRRGFRDMFSNRGGSAPSHAGTSGDHGGDIGGGGGGDGSVLRRHSTRRGRMGGNGGLAGNGVGGMGGRLIGQYPLHEWQRTTDVGENGMIASSVDGKKP